MGNKNILIVDDRNSEVWFIERTLQKSGFNTINAFTGQDGLQKAREAKPDLIVLDTGLPDIEGYDVYQALRNDAGTANIPVLFLTVNKELSEEKLKKLAAHSVEKLSPYKPNNRKTGIVGFLTRPLETSAITSMVQYLLQRYEESAAQNQAMVKPAPVLIIDDNRSTVALAELILKKEGFSVVTAYSGLDGINKVKTDSPRLILLDIVLPELNGFEILEKLRRFSRAPVIMLTVDTNLDSVQKAISLGANDYLLKPFSARELAVRVKKSLELSQGVTPVLS
jgi:DNA-binding response OmpR family regulator